MTNKLAGGDNWACRYVAMSLFLLSQKFFYASGLSEAHDGQREPKVSVAYVGRLFQGIQIKIWTLLPTHHNGDEISSNFTILNAWVFLVSEPYIIPAPINMNALEEMLQSNKGPTAAVKIGSIRTGLHWPSSPITLRYGAIKDVIINFCADEMFNLCHSPLKIRPPSS